MLVSMVFMFLGEVLRMGWLPEGLGLSGVSGVLPVLESIVGVSWLLTRSIWLLTRSIWLLTRSIVVVESWLLTWSIVGVLREGR